MDRKYRRKNTGNVIITVVKGISVSLILTMIIGCSHFVEHAGLITSTQVDDSSTIADATLAMESIEIITGDPENPQESKEIDNRIITNHCTNLTKTHYRKKAVFLGFTVNSRRDALDLGNIHTHYPTQLFTNVNPEQLLSIDNVDRTLPGFNSSNAITATEKQSIIKSFSDAYASQFLITGEITETGFQKENKNLANQLSIVNIEKVVNNEKLRQFTVKITLYDGFNGEAIDSHRFSGQSYDRHSIRNKPKSFSTQFFKTEYGQLIRNAINTQALWIENKIRCLPLRAKIVAHDDNGVTLNTGSESNIAIGDTLMLMAKAQHRQRLSTNIIDSFNPSGQVVVKSVYPHGAYAEFVRQSPKHRLAKGDLAQSE